MGFHELALDFAFEQAGGNGCMIPRASLPSVKIKHLDLKSH